MPESIRNLSWAVVRDGTKRRHVYRREVDLHLKDGKIVEITPQGWRVLNESPVRFRRSTTMLALPTPVPGGSRFDLAQGSGTRGQGDAGPGTDLGLRVNISELDVRIAKVGYGIDKPNCVGGAKAGHFEQCKQDFVRCPIQVDLAGLALQPDPDPTLTKGELVGSSISAPHRLIVGF
jgi:hypothetical protein